MAHDPIDFAGLAHALLQQADTLVPRWLPNGIERSGRWYIGDFDGSPGESANVNLGTGQWYDNAADDDKGGDLISLYARIHGLNNGQAARELMRDLGWLRDTTDAPVQASAPTAPAPAEPRGGDGPEPVGPAKKRKTMWKAVTPVPKRIASVLPKFEFPIKEKNGTWVTHTAVRHWAYEFEGELLGYVARFERISSDGELVKDTLPLTWCVDESDGQGLMRWRWKQWEQPRPLYVPAGLLSGDLSLPVVVVEGEKCAEAGHKLLGHEFDFVSWPGGCKTWQMAAWSWLMGRKVYLWPDADAKHATPTKAQREANVDPKTLPLLPAHKQPGTKAMIGIGSLLLAGQGCDVFMVRLPEPGHHPDGWDIADAIAEGWTADKVRDFIRGAAVYVAPDDAARAAAGNPGASTAPAGGGSGGDGGAPSDEDEELNGWRRYLLLSEKNAVKAVRENVVLALDGWPERNVPGAAETSALIAFNEFTNNVTKRRPTPWGTDAGDWDEADELLMGEWLVREKWLPSMSRGTLEEATLMVAKRHSYHPVREEIESYRGTWDGEKRLSSWLRHAAMTEDEIDAPLQDYLARVGTWMVMAICARVLTPERRNGELRVGPGCKFDYMPIFEGPQGWGKSTLAKVLGGDYFADTGLVLGEKDSYQNLQGILVYEWGELDSLNKSEVTKVKQFVSSQKDRFRASFDRRPRDYPRQVVFVGTTNEDHYLTDATGNRRFWPIRITKPVNVDWVRQVRTQLFAEALTYLDAGERFHPTAREQRDLFDPQQQQRTVENAIQSSIYRYLYDEDQKVPHGGLNGSLVNEISLSELMGRIGYVLDKQTPQVMKQAGAAMKHLGWTVRRAAADSDNKRPRVYVRPAKPQASAPRDSSTGSPQGHATERAADACPF